MDVFAAWTFGAIENDNGTSALLTIAGDSVLQDDRGNMESQIAVDDATDTMRVQVQTTAADTPTMRFTAHVTVTQTTYP